MSSAIWTAPGGIVPLLFVGTLEFRDTAIPVTGKDEWGIDTLTRTLRGPAFLFESYAAALRQGSVYNGYFLQSWQPSEHPYAPSLSLTYKGFQNGIPTPFITTDFCELCSSIQADGLHITISSIRKSPGNVIISATKEVRYKAPAAIYRYISVGEPATARFNATRSSAVEIQDSRIIATFDDGSTKVFTGQAPAALATALFANFSPVVTGPTAVPVFGTPYYECEERVQLQYPSN